MNFEMPMATAAMNNKVAAASEDGKCWDVIGEPLNEGVHQTLPGYDEKLDLNLRPKPNEKRQEILSLQWGKIEKDAARLEGLAAAMENISTVVKNGRDKLAHEWKGESFDAFRGAVEKVEQTLNDYAAAAKTTATGFRDAMTAAKTLYGEYKNTSTDIFAFNDLPKPRHWHKIGDSEIDYLKHCAGSWKHWTHCGKEEDTRNELTGKALKQSQYDWYHDWDGLDHDRDARHALGNSNETKGQIEDKIDTWYTATDDVKTTVGELHDAALENLRIMAELKVFSTMTVPAQEGEAQEPPGGNGDGDGTRDPGGGGRRDPGGGGGGDTPPQQTQPPPIQQPEPQPEPEPEPQPQPQPLPTQPQDAETVTIEEDGRKISVSSPDGQGHVKVTIDDGTGQPKTYDLDFGAGTGTEPAGTGKPGQDPIQTLPYPADAATGGQAGGTGGQAGGQGGPDGQPLGPDGQPLGPDGQPAPGGQAGEEATPVEAGPDGKCVISDPPLTITAERPAGATDTVVVTVDDGSGNPTTYTLDYSEGSEPSATPGAPTTIAQPLRTGAPDAAMAGAVPGPGGPTEGQGFAGPGAQGPVAPPAYAGPGPQMATPDVPGAAEPAAMGQPAGVGQAAPVGHAAEPVQLTTPAAEMPGGSASGFGGTQSGGEAGSFGAPVPDSYSNATGGSTGEAGLASAADSQPHQQGHGPGQSASGSGAMGGGMPMMAGMGGGAGGGGDQDRSAGQWRTAGDLFDDGYPESEGRLGGVLGSDDRGPQR